MWISEQFSHQPEDSGYFGAVSMGTASVGVQSGEAERRQLPLISPGGFGWCPDARETVLVLKEGGIVGRLQPDLSLNPGEVLLYTPQCAIRLTPEGEIHLTGQVFVNGTRIGGSANDESD